MYDVSCSPGGLIALIFAALASAFGGGSNSSSSFNFGRRDLAENALWTDVEEAAKI